MKIKNKEIGAYKDYTLSQNKEKGNIIASANKNEPRDLRKP